MKREFNANSDQVGAEMEDVESFSPEQRLENILDNLAESILSASEEEVIEEAAMDGIDPAEEADRVRHMLLKAAQSCMCEETREDENSGAGSSEKVSTPKD